jgi:serine/threonine protein kinase
MISLSSREYANKFDPQNKQKPKFKKMCSDLKNIDKSKLFKFLGSGTYGKVFLSKGDISKKLNELLDSSTNRDVVVKKVKGAEVIDKCFKNIEVRSKDKKTRTYKNAFVCSKKGVENIITEYYMSLYASQLSKYNFIDTYAIQHCPKETGYIFMEKIDDDLASLFSPRSKHHPSDDDMKIIILQILYALHLLHTSEIMHCDAHIGNIFYVSIDAYPELKKSDCLLFDFTCKANKHLPENARKFYIPTSKVKYIIKLGDFGMASKFSEPYIFNDIIFDHKEFVDYFSPMYDIIVAFSSTVDSHLYTQIQCFLKGMSPCYLLDPVGEKEKDMFVDYYKKYIESYISNTTCYWSKFGTRKSVKAEYDTTKHAVDCYRYLSTIEDDKKIRKHVSNLREYLQVYRSAIFFVEDLKVNNKKVNRNNLNFDLTRLHETLPHQINATVVDIIQQSFFQQELKNLRSEKSKNIFKM